MKRNGKMSPEARKRISESMKKRHAALKNGGLHPPQFDPPLPSTRSAVEFTGSYDPNNGALTVTVVLGRYNSVMTNMVDAMAKLQ